LNSRLVSIVSELESEAERILQEAKKQAAEIRQAGESARARLNEKMKADAKREAQQLLQSTLQQTQNDIELSRAEAKESIAALLHRAEARLEKGSKLILDKLGKL
jgi:F0F1-type ATP synthase membrane subunit b/b'